MADDSINLPPSFFDGGEPQSEIAPGDTTRELIHEARNLRASLELMREIFQRLLPALESLENIDEMLNRQARNQRAEGSDAPSQP